MPTPEEKRPGRRRALDPVQVRTARQLYGAFGMSYRKLAERFAVNPMTVRAAVRGEHPYDRDDGTPRRAR